MIHVKYHSQAIKERMNFVPSSEGAAGYDLRVDIAEKYIIQPGERVKFGSGLAVHISHKHIAGIIVPRSGLGSKGVVISNSVGVIDSDYTGEIALTLLNTTQNTYIEIEPYMRVAQILFMPVLHPQFMEVDFFEEVTERGSNGFGSTGSC